MMNSVIEHPEIMIQKVTLLVKNAHEFNSDLFKELFLCRSKETELSEIFLNPQEDCFVIDIFVRIDTNDKPFAEDGLVAQIIEMVQRLDAISLEARR